MPGSQKFTSILHEISHLICVITSGSCLEKSSDFKHCFGPDIEATVEPGHRVKSLLVSTLQIFASRNRSATPEIHTAVISVVTQRVTTLITAVLPSRQIVSQRNIARGYLVRL